MFGTTTTRRLVAALLLTACGASVEAQTFYMRQSLGKQPQRTAPSSPSQPVETPEPVRPAITWSWSSGEWSAWSSDCSQTAVRMRAVSCTSSAGAVGQDASCTGSRPASSQTSTIVTGCPVETHSYSWRPEEWSAWSSVCSASSVRARTVTCVRDDGRLSGDASCEAGTRPASSEVKEDYSGCSNRIQYNDADLGRNQYCQGRVTVTQNVWCVNRYGTPQDMSVCTAEGISAPPPTISLPCSRKDSVTGNAFWSNGIPPGYTYRTGAYPGRLSESEATAKALAQCNASDYLADVQNHGFCYFVSYTWVPSANVTIVEAGPRNSAGQGSAGSYDMTGAQKTVLNRFNTVTHEFVIDDRSMDRFQRRLIQCGNNFAVSDSNNYVAAVSCTR